MKNPKKGQGKHKNSLQDDPQNSVGDYLNTMLPIPKQRGNSSILPKKTKAKGNPYDEKAKIIKKDSNMNNKDSTSINNETKFENLRSFNKKFWIGEDGEELPSEQLKETRKSIGVLVKGNLKLCPPPIDQLDHNSLPIEFKNICTIMNINKPSPVQMQCWPAILNGSDVLGIAPTGSGKTLSFCLPMIPHIQYQLQNKDYQHEKLINKSKYLITPIALVLVPTRELAIQVQTVLKPLKRQYGITSGVVYGGIDKNEQLQKLKSNCNESLELHILVATPGRLEDFIQANNRSDHNQILNIDITNVTYLVIDEADRMLALGFMEQLQIISQCIRLDRQTLLFSATFPGRLRELSEKWVKEAIVIRCNAIEFNDHSKVSTNNITSNTTTNNTNNNNNNTNSSNKIENNHNNESINNNDNNDGKNNSELSVNNNNDSNSNKKMKLHHDCVNIVELNHNNDNLNNTIIQTSNIINTNTNEETSSIQDTHKPISIILDTKTSTTINTITLSTNLQTSSLTISPTIIQKIHVCANHKKPRLLLKYIQQCRENEKIMKIRQAGAMIIFTNKIKTLKFVQDFLKRQNIQIDILHGQLNQNIRENILNDFKSGKLNVLIATDVAARGIHINRLKYVINYDFPLNLEQYCHRVGRTGRQDSIGYAYSFLTRNLAMLSKDLIKLLQICKQVIEPNLIKLANDYEIGNIIDGVYTTNDPQNDDDEEEDEDSNDIKENDI